MRDYAVVFEKTRTGYSAYVPDLPGLIAAAATLDETERLMREAMEMHLGSMLEDGDPIPEATTRTSMMRTGIVEAWSPQLAKTA